MWLSLVERCVRDAEAAGSNPVISTRNAADAAQRIKNGEKIIKNNMKKITSVGVSVLFFILYSFFFFL